MKTLTVSKWVCELICDLRLRHTIAKDIHVRSFFFPEQSKYADKASRMNRGSWHFPFPPSWLQHFDFPLPSPVRLFEMVVAPEQEYPLVCIGVSRGSTHSAPVHVDYINLNSNTSWFTNTGLGMFWRLFMCISKVSGHHYSKLKKKKPSWLCCWWVSFYVPCLCLLQRNLVQKSYRSASWTAARCLSLLKVRDTSFIKYLNIYAYWF